MELSVKLDVNETVSLGDIIKIEMMDGSVIEREVKIINPKKYLRKVPTNVEPFFVVHYSSISFLSRCG